MKTCVECKDDACANRGSLFASSCEDFTGAPVHEVNVPWCPTLEDYNMLRARYNDSIHRETILRDRVTHFEQAVAGVVRWASEEAGDE